MSATPTAADLLRQALADAPDGLHVARDGWNDLTILNARSAHLGSLDKQRAMRPIGLLLAAAPHLVDLLADPSGESPSWPEVNLRRAITEAAQAMEAES